MPCLLDSTFYEYPFTVTAIPCVCQSPNSHSYLFTFPYLTEMLNRVRVCWLFSAQGLEVMFRANIILWTTERAYRNPKQNLLVILAEHWIISLSYIYLGFLLYSAFFPNGKHVLYHPNITLEKPEWRQSKDSIYFLQVTWLSWIASSTYEMLGKHLVIRAWSG